MALTFEVAITWTEAHDLGKHRVSFDEAGPRAFDESASAKLLPDEDQFRPRNSERLIGHSVRDRSLVVSFTKRGRDSSASSVPGSQLRHERKAYEENQDQ